MEAANTFTPTLIIPVIDERIGIPGGAPREQQQKIATYNELLEEIYQRKTELVTLEGRLSGMKFEIEGDIAHLGLKSPEDSGSADKRSSITAVAAFVPSSSPPPSAGVANDGVVGGTGTTIAMLRGMTGATRGLKSRGKGKGRQERAKLNGTGLKYKRGGAIGFGDDQYYDLVYDSFRADEDEEGTEHDDEEDEEEEQGDVTSENKVAVPASSN